MSHVNTPLSQGLSDVSYADTSSPALNQSLTQGQGLASLTASHVTYMITVVNVVFACTSIGTFLDSSPSWHYRDSRDRNYFRDSCKGTKDFSFPNRFMYAGSTNMVQMSKFVAHSAASLAFSKFFGRQEM